MKLAVSPAVQPDPKAALSDQLGDYLQALAIDQKAPLSNELAHELLGRGLEEVEVVQLLLKYFQQNPEYNEFYRQFDAAMKARVEAIRSKEEELSRDEIAILQAYTVHQGRQLHRTIMTGERPPEQPKKGIAARTRKWLHEMFKR